MVDLTDPCQLVTYLTEAYARLLTGSQSSEVQIGDRRTRRFQPPDITQLEGAIMRAQAACDIQNGKTPKRYAISFGGVRRTIGVPDQPALTE